MKRITLAVFAAFSLLSVSVEARPAGDFVITDPVQETEVCSQSDALQAMHEAAVKTGDPAAVAASGNMVLCCNRGYEPGSDAFDCCVAHADGGIREILRECPNDAAPQEPTPEEPQTQPATPNDPTEPQQPLDPITPVEPTAPAPPSEPSDPSEPVDPVAPVAEEPAGAVEEGIFTCEVAREEDIGPDGKTIAVSPDGLVPFVIRYRHPSASPALSVELRQIEGLPVAITDITAGSESIAGKSLVSALGTEGEAQWVVYLSRPASLVGDWDPDAAFSVTVSRNLDSEGAVTLEASCLASAHVQGGQGGCSMAGAGSRGGKEGMMIAAAVIALALFRSRKTTGF